MVSLRNIINKNQIPLKLKIRFAKYTDLKNIVDIYNQAIQAGNATADINEVNYNERENWFLEHSSDKYPIYVIELNNNIIGWGSISPYRKGREGLKETAEISYYLDYNFHGQGYGRKLIEFMIADCKRLGIKNLIALLLEINQVSIVILEKIGFTKWGFMPDVVNLEGVRCGHLIYGKKVVEENEMYTKINESKPQYFNLICFIRNRIVKILRRKKSSGLSCLHYGRKTSKCQGL